MTRLPAATFSDALTWWQFSATWWAPDRACTPLWCADWPDGKRWWARGPRAPLAGQVRDLDERYDVEIRMGLPHLGGFGRSLLSCGVGRASMLWARVEGPDQLARARRFRPLPSLVFAEGSSSRRLLWWPLEEALPWVEVKEANKKIAYALHAVQRHGDPDALEFSPPGTCLRDGRTRPVPVSVARMTLETFDAGAVAGRLKSPPEPAWMDLRGSRR